MRLLVCLGVLALGLPAPAEAASGTLYPDVDTIGAEGGWAAGPNAASPFWMVLDDTGANPGPSDNHIFFAGPGPATAEVGIENFSVPAGEQVVLVRAWAFVRATGGRPLDWELRTGSRTLTSGRVPAGSADAWRSLSHEEGLTQAEANDLRVRFTAPSTGDTGRLEVPVARAEYQTALAPPAPVITSAPAGPSTTTAVSWQFTSAVSALSNQCLLERDGAVVSTWATCASPRPYTLSGDGTYRFRVRSTGSAGVPGPIASSSYVLDTTAPGPPAITGGPTGLTTQTTPAFTFTAEAGAQTWCRLDRDGSATPIEAWTACASGKTYNLALAGSDGAYTFRVRARDAAGNDSVEGVRAFTLDTTPPPQPAITAPASPGQGLSPSWSFTAEAGSTTHCQLEKDAAVLSGWAACTSPQAPTLPAGETDGTFRLRVLARDAAGRDSPEAVAVYVLDRTKPVPPSVTSGPSGTTQQDAVSFAFDAEPGSAVECRLRGGATGTFDTWSACPNPRSFSLADEDDGTWTFEVRATDAAGNVGDPGTRVFTLDRDPPGAPAVTGPASPSPSRSPSWSFTAEAAATTRCRLEKDGDVVVGWAACTSPFSRSLPEDEADGTFTLRVTATDAAGWESPEAVSTFVFDRTPPASPVITAGPSGATRDATPEWEFTSDDPASCLLERDGVAVGGWTACSATQGYTLTADDVYTFSIRATDAAGNHSTPAATRRITLDTAVPAAPDIVSGPTGDSPDATPAFGFAGEAGAPTECRLDRDSTAVEPWTPCASPKAYTLSVDGVHTFRVRSTDAAGNVSPEGTRTYRLDSSIPIAPTLTARPSSPSADRAPSWSFTGTSGMTFECRFRVGTADGPAWAPCVSPYSASLPATDGSYHFEVRQVSALGKRGEHVHDDYALDVTAPGAPVLTSAPQSASRASAPAWEFTAEDGASVECRLRLGDADVRTWAPCTSPRQFGLAGEPDGEYTFAVRARDAAGNVGPATTHTHVLDRVAPAPPAMIAGPGPLGAGRAPAWSFTAEPGAALQCLASRGDAPMSGWAPCTSPHVLGLDGRPDGAYALAVRAVDAAGNEGAVTTAGYELDTTPGAVQILAGPGPLGRLRTPSWSFGGEDGAAFECRLTRGEAAVADWGPCTTPRAFDLAGVADGVLRFAARATDRAGNVGPVADTDYELDTTAPRPPVIEARPAAVGEDASPTWRFSGEPGAAFACRVERRSGAVVRAWAPCVSPYTANLLRADAGEYRLQVTATDRAGNTGPAVVDGFELREAPVREPAPAARDADRTGAPPAAPAGPAAPAPRAGDRDPSPSDPGDDRGRSMAREEQAAAPAPRREAAPASTKPRRPSAAPRRRPAARRSASRPAASAPRETPPKPDTPARRLKGAAEAVGKAASEAARAVATAVTEHPDKSVFPSSLIFLVLGFLGVQNRIDRSDPKLALAPVSADPDLEFPPAPDAEGDQTP